MLLNGDVILRLKGQGQWEQKCKNCFSWISSSKVDRFTSNPDHSTHIIKYISSAEMLHFLIICNHQSLSMRATCRGGPVAVHLLVIW